MQRLIYEDLLKWKNKMVKKPLMVYGTRQVGKTYIIEEFCKNEYKNWYKIDLKERSEYINLFESSLNFEEIYETLKLRLENTIDIENKDSIIFF